MLLKIKSYVFGIRVALHCFPTSVKIHSSNYLMSKQVVKVKNEMVYTTGGFGVKSIPKETIRKNLGILRQIAKEAKKFMEKK